MCLLVGSDEERPFITVIEQTPLELLHVMQLGIIKYLLRYTLGILAKQENKKDILKARLRGYQDCQGVRNFNPHAIVNNAASLLGRDFKEFVQCSYAVLQGLVDEKLLAVWKYVQLLCRLLYRRNIGNSSDYLKKVEKALRYLKKAISECPAVQPVIIKPKLHMLYHADRFIYLYGSLMLLTTERFESMNKLVRRAIGQTNRHDTSRDVARIFCLKQTAARYFSEREANIQYG
jgi:hypothetical protein